MENKSYSGVCHCGKVSFKISEGVGVIACHCSDCQKLHGNFNPMLIVDENKIVFSDKTNIQWYNSSDKAKRAFCNNCGSRLFKKANESNQLLIAMGLLGRETSLNIIKNLYYDVKPDWY